MTSLHDPKAGVRRESMRWHAAFWTMVLLTSTLVVSGLHRAASELYSEKVRWLGSRYDIIDRSLNRIYEIPTDSRHRSIVFFGDSTVSQYDHGLALPYLTGAHLSQMRGRPWIKTLSAAAPGSGIVQYGFLADHVASYEPDLVIWQLSFFQFTDRWTARNGAPELVGFVHSERLPEIIAMPVQRYRLSLSDILLQQGIVRLGLHDAHGWLRESQMRFAHMIDLAEDALNPNRGRKPEARAQTLRGRGYMRRHMDMTLSKRYSAHGERVHFGRTLEGLDPDDAKLQLLRSGIRALTGDGIDVLVYLNPTNVDHLRHTGVSYEAGLQRTVNEIRRAAEESGAHFLDLHEMLEDPDFDDAAGHFLEDEIQTVPQRVSARIAEAALPILLERERGEEQGRREAEREGAREAMP